MVIVILCNDHLTYLLDLNSFQIHNNGLSFNSEVILVFAFNILKQFVVECLLDGHPFVRIELERLLQEILHQRIDELENLLEGPLLDFIERLDVVPGSFIGDELDIGGSANNIENDRSIL